MYFQWIFAAIAFSGAVTAIPCSEIGWSSGMGGAVPPKYPDPFDPQGRWEVVDAKRCFIRWQTYDPKKNEHPNTARVTKTKFEATPSTVWHTINHFFGSDGNIQLWLPLNTKAFQYARLLPGNLGPDFEVVEGQNNLEKDRLILSIILPSGVDKLEVVRPRSSESDESNANIKRTDDLGITGLAGKISSSDWAYATAVEAQWVLINLYNEQKESYIKMRPINLKNAWLTAEKADPNECVVLDFRKFEDFILRPRPWEAAGN